MANDISKIKTPDGVVHDLKDSRVPANAKFTDTNYYHTTGSWNGLTYTATANGGAGALALTLPTGTTSTTVARGDHTHTTSIATSTGTNQLTLALDGKYSLTAGGSSYVFTMPSSFLPINITGTNITEKASTWRPKTETTYQYLWGTAITRSGWNNDTGDISFYLSATGDNNTWLNMNIDGHVYSHRGFVGNLTGNVTGNLTGNASTATTASKLGTATVGTAWLPIYLNGGSPTAVSGMGEAYLVWGGKSFAGTYGPIDAAMIGVLGANRFEMLRCDTIGGVNKIDFLYSRDGGTSWTDYGYTAVQKRQHFSLFAGGAGLTIGKRTASETKSVNDRARVIIHTASNVYTTLNKFAIYLSTNGSGSCWVTIDVCYQEKDYTVESNWRNVVSKQQVGGWSGWNIINTPNITTYGNRVADQDGHIRFTFGADTAGSTSYAGLTVSKIAAFGGVGWGVPSTPAANSLPFDYRAEGETGWYTNFGGNSIRLNGTAVSLNGHTHTFASLTSKPTTLSGYGITDALPLSGGALTGDVTLATGKTIRPAAATNSCSLGTSSYKWNNAHLNNLTVYSSLSLSFLSSGILTYDTDSGEVDSLAFGASTAGYLRADGVWANPSNTTYSAGTGLSLSGTTFNHSNSVTAVTTAGLYKVKYDAQGHITGTTAVAKADITALGIPGSNTTYSAGTGLTLSGTTFSVSSANVSTMMNLLSEGGSNATRNDYAIVQYAGGGTSTTTYHRRKLANVFAALNSSDITTALGYTPYNSTNPNGYTSNAGTVTRIISGTGLTGGPITSSGTLSVRGLPESTALGGEKQPIYWDHENGFVAGTAIGASAYHADSYFAAASHAHGNITSAGAVTTTATIASGDRLLITDSSASSKVCASGITFGTGTGTFLNNKGEWGTPGGTNAGHTHTLKITNASGTTITNLAPYTQYTLTVGNATMQFRTPYDTTCLAEGTKILMADNSEKNIEDVVAGDIIMSYDPNTEKLCEAVIIDNIPTGRSDDFVNYYFDDGSFLSIFGKHCIYNADEGTARGVDYWEPGWKTIGADGKEVMYIGSENIHNAGRKCHFDLHSSNKLYFANGILNAQSLTLDYPLYKDDGLPEEFITALKADFDSSANLHTHQFDKKTGSILAPILKELKAQKKVMDDNKKRLADSDYLVAKFTEGLISAAEWLKAKAERAGWRSAVNKAEPLYAAAEERYKAFKAEYAPTNTKRERFNAAVARDNACLDALKAYYKSKNELSK